MSGARQVDRAGRTAGSRLVPRWLGREWTPAEVVGAGAGVLLVALIVRAWVVVPSYFFLDDYIYLADARSADLDAAWLFAPYNGHLMPGARLLISAVAERGPADWVAAATVSLLLQAWAFVAFWWMLLRLFGPRPVLLLPLTLFVTSAITVPAFVWWAAAINLAPVQATLFTAIGCWVEVMRTGRRSWLAGALASVTLGLAFDVRAVLAIPVLAALSLGWFATGSLRARVVAVLRLRPGAVLSVVALGGAYTVAYLLVGDRVTSVPDPAVAGRLLLVALGETLPLGAVGGPWWWSAPSPPTAQADPTAAGVLAAWVLLLVVVTWLARRRTRTLGGWLLALAYSAVLVVLVAGTRAEAGAAAAREYRFLVESAGLLALALALAVLPLRGAPGASAPRTSAARPAHPVLVALAVAVVAAGGLASTVTYAGHWHRDNASAPYVDRLTADLAAVAPVDLAETRVPEDVISRLAFPRNTTRTIAEALGADAAFPQSSDDLAVVAADGGIHEAAVDRQAVSPRGPTPGCGWQVQPGTEVTIPLSEEVATGLAWLRIGYLTGEGTTVTVTAGGTVVQQPLRQGLGSLFLLHDGGFSSVSVATGDSSTDLCVDTVEVGDLEPAAERRAPLP